MTKRGYSDPEIEKDILEKGLTAPRLTPEYLESLISNESYVFFGTMTVCCLTLQNGYQVIGESAPVSSKNFDAEMGRNIARQHARDKMWALEGYLLKQKLFEGKQ